MKDYSTNISLIKNRRGVYCLDTIMGCAAGMANNTNGCYGNCYAAKSAKIYGYDFNKVVLRDFINERHRRFILRQINKIPLDFIRIGASGDPSQNWEHTISVLKKIDRCNKQIVIITRHWNCLSELDLRYFKKINVCINTSISALDKPHIFDHCIEQYERIKPFCKSILRVVSCDFDTHNETGRMLSKVQDLLFKHNDTLETVLRINKQSELVKNHIINTRDSEFLGSKALISERCKNIFFGKCNLCHEMCGINIGRFYFTERPIVKQLSLF